MRKLIYKKKAKAVLTILQVLAAAVMTYCLLNIEFWMEDSYSLTEMARSYEESNLFLRQVTQILSNKIRGQQNQELFEDDGEYDPEKEIDIQAYGNDNIITLDMNTTYLLGELLEFARDGGSQRMHRAIQEALQQQGENGREAGETLDEQAASLETISPVTGIPLSECSRWYSDPADFVLEMYQHLSEVSSDIYSRYLEYTTAQDESWSSGAPSNLRYCIEDTATGKLYTNTEEESYEAAVEAIRREEGFVSLYEGERSFNIMVTNPDSVLNAEAGEWFMEERFVNTNERVYIAVDTSYPVGDELQVYADSFAQRETIVWISLAGTGVCAVILIAGFVLLLMGSGRGETPEAEAVSDAFCLASVDRVPTELAAGLYMTAAVLAVNGRRWLPDPMDMTGDVRAAASIASAALYFLFLTACQSLVRRLRTRTLWSNSIARMLLRTWKKVTASRAASGQLLFFYIVFFVLNFLFLLFGTVGIFLIFVMDMAVLLYLLRDMAGKQSVWEGIHQISRGDLEYKIDTTTLQGETYEMARAVNEMGDGLQKAVEAIVKNERLKAELITNVSHDIKTPLTSIVNYVDLLKRENLQGERVQRYIEVLDQKSQRLKQLTEDLVEASKISSGNVELQMVRMQLQSMIRQAWGEYQERLEEKELTPVWKMDPEPAWIMADGRQLWRILENLLSNIYKYAMERTQIYIELYREEGMVYLSLKNTSAQKLPEDAGELAGRFVRGDRSRSTEGSGLGLSIAQSLAHLQGGTFGLSSQGDLFQAVVGFPEAL